MLIFTGPFMTALSDLYYSYTLVLFYAVNNRVSLIIRRTRKSAFWQSTFHQIYKSQRGGMSRTKFYDGEGNKNDKKAIGLD